MGIPGLILLGAELQAPGPQDSTLQAQRDKTLLLHTEEEDIGILWRTYPVVYIMEHQGTISYHRSNNNNNNNNIIIIPTTKTYRLKNKKIIPDEI